MTLEHCLARLYTDEAFLQRFLADADSILSTLDPETAAALRTINRDDLQAAASSYRAKRLSRSPG